MCILQDTGPPIYSPCPRRQGAWFTTPGTGERGGSQLPITFHTSLNTEFYLRFHSVSFVKIHKTETKLDGLPQSVFSDLLHAQCCTLMSPSACEQSLWLHTGIFIEVSVSFHRSQKKNLSRAHKRAQVRIKMSVYQNCTCKGADSCYDYSCVV